jgi:pimeloyl-ACP methyl ester carboxylesterase
MFIYCNLELLVSAATAVAVTVGAGFNDDLDEGSVRSADGVEIAYTVAGRGGTALVFIHGGLADRSFWAPQITALSDSYRIVAVDLAGHGASGCNREVWTIAAFGEDVRAVADALDLRRIVLVGNSLGGAVALHTASLLKGRAIGVIGVDTLHDAKQKVEPAEAKARADAFRKDFAATCREMVKRLFHSGKEEKLQAWAEARMLAMSPEVVVGMMEGFAGYDAAEAFRAAGVPIRAINGDLFSTQLELNRGIVPDFDAVIMKGAGHYPMLERPEEFNKHLLEIVKSLVNVGK